VKREINMNKNFFRFGLAGLLVLLMGGMVAGLAHTFGGHIPSLPAGFEGVAGGAGALLLLGVTAVPEAGAAGAPLMPKDSKDLEGVRGFFSGLRQQFASTATIYTGPIKSLFDDVVAKLDAALAALPKTTDTNWSLNDQLENFFYLLNSANCVANTLGLELSKVKQQMASIGPEAIAAAVKAGTYIPKTDFETAVSAAVAARTVAGGDLVPKATVTQLCSAAKDLGLKEGRSARDQELAATKVADELATGRRTALTTAGLPLPEAEVEAILRAPETDFAAARTLAEGRLLKLTEAGIELTPELRSKAWLPEAGYDVFHKTVSAIPSLRRSTTLPEPLAGGALDNTGKKMVM
jgi:hypothetical protein